MWRTLLACRVDTFSTLVFTNGRASAERRRGTQRVRAPRSRKARRVNNGSGSEPATRAEYNLIVTKSSRIPALDLGKIRIGLALSDELGLTAQGLKQWSVRRRDDIETLRRLTVQSNVELILIGDPIHMSGGSRPPERLHPRVCPRSRIQNRPARKIWDERWTSREAETTLRGSGIAPSERKPAIDRLSAVILLQSSQTSA